MMCHRESYLNIGFWCFQRLRSPMYEKSLCLIFVITCSYAVVYRYVKAFDDMKIKLSGCIVLTLQTGITTTAYRNL